MFRTTFSLLIFVSVLFVVHSSVIKPALRLPEADEELRKYIRSASFQAVPDFNNDILENDVVRVRGEAEEVDGKLDDVYLKQEDDEIFLTEIKIIKQSAPHLRQLQPDFMYGYMGSELRWKEVIAEGLLEFHQKQNSAFTVVEGKVRLTWNQISAHGKIAFLPSETSDELHSTNYELNFTSRKFEIMFMDKSNKIEDDEALLKAEKLLKTRLEEDVFWELQENSRQYIDSYLQKQNLLVIFGNQKDITNRYKRYMTEMSININNFVDEILFMVKAGVTESGFWRYELPDIREEFSKKFGFIRFWGHLALWNGEVEDIRTIKRKTDFSLIINDGIYEFSGTLEASQLWIKYNNYQAKIWNIGPSGKVSAKVHSNALSVNFKAVVDRNSLFGYKILSNQLKLHISNIDVSATGLSVILNWLLSLIVTLVVNIIKGDISGLIEQSLTNALNLFTSSFM